MELCATKVGGKERLSLKKGEQVRAEGEDRKDGDGSKSFCENSADSS